MKKLHIGKRGSIYDKIGNYIIVIVVVAMVIILIYKANVNKYWSYLPGFQSSDKRTLLPEITDGLWSQVISNDCALIGYIDKNYGVIYELYVDGKEIRDLKLKDGELYYFGEHVGGINNGIVVLYDGIYEKYKISTRKEEAFIAELNNAKVLDEVFLCGDKTIKIPGGGGIIEEKPDLETPDKIMNCEGTGEDSYEGECKSSCNLNEISIGGTDCFLRSIGRECCIEKINLYENGCPIALSKNDLYYKDDVSCSESGNGNQCFITEKVYNVLSNSEIQNYAVKNGCRISSVCEGKHSTNSLHYIGKAIDFSCVLSNDNLGKLKELKTFLDKNIEVEICNSESTSEFDCCKRIENIGKDCCDIHSPLHLHCQFPEGDKEIPLYEKEESDYVPASGDLLIAMKFAKTNVVKNSVGSPKSCNYPDGKENEYAIYIEKHSASINFDPLIILAMMIQESNCDANAISGGDHGLMQINSGTFGECYNQIINGVQIGTNIQDIVGVENAEKNIACAVKVLENKRTQVVLNYGLLYIERCDNTYSGNDVVLRAYNGLGNDCNSGDPNYVENINAILNQLKQHIVDTKTNQNA